MTRNYKQMQARHLLIIALALVSLVSTVYAIPVTVSTNQQSYKAGDQVLIHGITDNNTMPVTLTILDEQGNLINVNQVWGNSTGYFSEIVTVDSLWKNAGTYDLKAESGSADRMADVKFQFLSNNTSIGEPPVYNSTNATVPSCPNCNQTVVVTPPPVVNSPPVIESPPVVNTPADNDTKQIPNWVKAVFGWYSEGKISDSDLIQALQFLIQQGIIKVN